MSPYSRHHPDERHGNHARRHPMGPTPPLHSPARSTPPGATSHERRCCGRCAGHRWRQCRTVRRPHGARSGRQRAAARIRPARLARRQLGPHTQPALHARCAAGRAGRCLPRGRVLARPAQGDGRADQRTSGAPGDPRVEHLPPLDAPPRRALSARAGRHAACGTHQRVLHGWRQGAGQCLLPQRGAAGRADPLRGARGPHRDGRPPLHRCPPGQRRAHCRQELRAGRRRL